MRPQKGMSNTPLETSKRVYYLSMYVFIYARYILNTYLIAEVTNKIDKRLVGDGRVLRNTPDLKKTWGRMPPDLRKTCRPHASGLGKNVQAACLRT